MSTMQPVSKWQAFKARLDTLRDKLTKWVNVALGAVATFDATGALQHLPEIQPYLPVNLYAKALMLMAIWNFLSHNVLKHRTSP